MNKNIFKKGFSLVEIIISVSILSLIIVTVSTFQKDVFSLNTNLQSNLNIQLDARHLIKTIVAELRKTTSSAVGAYPIELASSTGITFYSDVNNNGSIDKIRYYLSGQTIKRGVISPTGSPAVYNSGSEVTTTLINYVIASSTVPIFQYYTSSYTGTSSPLSIPVDISSVRLVKITVILDTDPNRSPVPITVTSQVNLRNLKDNL
ncbi:MAG: prepilin-type N-terminal cleavage/methylation domain-containing protein [Minisyncoccia bacterium]